MLPSLKSSVEPILSSCYRLHCGILASHLAFQHTTNFVRYLLSIFDTDWLSLVPDWMLLWRCIWSMPAALTSHNALSTCGAVPGHWREFSFSYASLSLICQSDQRATSTAKQVLVRRKVRLHQGSQPIFSQPILSLLYMQLLYMQLLYMQLLYMQNWWSWKGVICKRQTCISLVLLLSLSLLLSPPPPLISYFFPILWSLTLPGLYI